MPAIYVFLTEPHAAHRVSLVEDDADPGMRIYEVSDAFEATDTRSRIGFTGEEIESLARWWKRERRRRTKRGGR